jgi:hypothetical protein
LIFLSINILTYYSSNKNVSKKENRILSKGSISFGLYNSNGKIIDNGSTILINDKKVNHFIEISQVLPDKREYLIMAFLDFKQVPFYVEKNKHKNYKISLDGEDTIRVYISLDILESSKELSYIIIKMPDYKLNNGELKKANLLQEVMALRFDLGGKKVLEYETDYKKSPKKPLDNIFISEKESVLKVKYNAKPEEYLYITLGNLEDYEINYNLIALLDWEQVPINDDIVKTFNLKENERIFFDLKIPNVIKDSNYQILAFPNPYAVNSKKLESTFVYGSHRLNIRP